MSKKHTSAYITQQCTRRVFISLLKTPKSDYDNFTDTHNLMEGDAKETPISTLCYF
mgnify:CR=1 FL=1